MLCTQAIKQRKKSEGAASVGKNSKMRTAEAYACGSGLYPAASIAAVGAGDRRKGAAGDDRAEAGLEIAEEESGTGLEESGDMKKADDKAAGDDMPFEASMLS